MGQSDLLITPVSCEVCEERRRELDLEDAGVAQARRLTVNAPGTLAVAQLPSGFSLLLHCQAAALRKFIFS